MTVQWAAELGIPEEVATTLATWEVAVLTRTEKRFVDKLCGAGMDEADATKAWDKLQERRNGTCAALCFAWRARFWQSRSPDPSCSPLAVSSLFSRVSSVSLFSLTGRVAVVAMPALPAHLLALWRRLNLLCAFVVHVVVVFLSFVLLAFGVRSCC